jgi:hypothetical protein
VKHIRGARASASLKLVVRNAEQEGWVYIRGPRASALKRLKDDAGDVGKAAGSPPRLRIVGGDDEATPIRGHPGIRSLHRSGSCYSAWPAGWNGSGPASRHWRPICPTCLRSPARIRCAGHARPVNGRVAGRRGTAAPAPGPAVPPPRRRSWRAATGKARASLCRGGC